MICIMKNIFICNTPYQIIVAYCIARNILSKDVCDIFISDHFASSLKIVRRLKEKSICFNKVYFGETNKWQLSPLPNKIPLFREDCVEMAENIDILNYDRCIYSNRDIFGINLLDYIVKKKPDMIIGLMEDGFSTYSFDKVGYLDGNNIESHVGEFYFFFPKLLSWKPNGTIVEVPRYFDTDMDLRDEINRVFGFYNTMDSYEYKYIFFESGLIGLEDENLMGLLEDITKVIGKENLLVKLHPRTQSNIDFIKEGYNINNDYEIPWEVIALNIDLKDKILITNFSQSVVTPRLLFGKEYKVLFFSDVVATNDFERNFSDYMKDYVFHEGEDLFVPQNRNELMSFVTAQKMGEK